MRRTDRNLMLIAAAIARGAPSPTDGGDIGNAAAAASTDDDAEGGDEPPTERGLVELAIDALPVHYPDASPPPGYAVAGSPPAEHDRTKRHGRCFCGWCRQRHREALDVFRRYHSGFYNSWSDLGRRAKARTLPDTGLDARRSPKPYKIHPRDVRVIRRAIQIDPSIGVWARHLDVPAGEYDPEHERLKLLRNHLRDWCFGRSYEHGDRFTRSALRLDEETDPDDGEGARPRHDFASTCGPWGENTADAPDERRALAILRDRFSPGRRARLRNLPNAGDAQTAGRSAMVRFVVYTSRVDVLGLGRPMTAEETAAVWLAVQVKLPKGNADDHRRKIASTARAVEQYREAYVLRFGVTSGAAIIAHMRAHGLPDHLARAGWTASDWEVAIAGHDPDAEYPSLRKPHGRKKKISPKKHAVSAESAVSETPSSNRGAGHYFFGPHEDTP